MTIDPTITIILVAQVSINMLIIYLWNSAQLVKFHGVYKAEQKIHEGFIPRFGGLSMILSLFLFNYFNRLSNNDPNILNHIFICLIPLIVVTFLEDVYNNILPLARLFFIFLSTFLVLSTGNFSLPMIDLPIIATFLFNYPWVLILLLTIAMAGMVNAFNLVDGANGLLLMSFISILGCLLIMANLMNDEIYTTILFQLLLICFIQFPFNFPKARIFAGDLGAYSFGFIIGVIVISFFGKHPEFLTWQAILILFYPAFELIFTVIRRVKQNNNPLQADRLHLHQLLFQFLYNLTEKHNLSNALTSLILVPLWGFAFMWLMIYGAQLDLMLTSLGLFINMVIYIVYYKLAFRLSRNGE
jgi:UDP-N-acetylmuramyl pentapeptide phosphotransferase/UDP-N-acetylglucosamine-1-phosphate transferase